MIKLVRFTRHGAHGHDAFVEQWRDQHGPRIAARQVDLGIMRYVQTHRDVASAGLAHDAVRLRGGLQPAFDGAEEFWWPSEEALADFLADDGASLLREICAPLSVFLSQSDSPAWLARDYPQIMPSDGVPQANVKSGIRKILFAISPAEHLTADAARQYWLFRHGPMIRSYSSVRGLLCYNQVHRCQDDLWPDLAKSLGCDHSDYIGHAEAWVSGLDASGGSERDLAVHAAVADERRFIDHGRSTLLIGKELIFVDRNWL